MPFNPEAFLEVARSLKKGRAVDSGEPCDRTIVGRAYYTAYLALREVVRRSYGKPHLYVDHSRLRTTLAASSDADVSEAGELLKVLYEARRKADYDLSGSVTKVDAALMVGSAQGVLDLVPKIDTKIPPGIT